LDRWTRQKIRENERKEHKVRIIGAKNGIQRNNVVMVYLHNQLIDYISDSSISML